MQMYPLITFVVIFQLTLITATAAALLNKAGSKFNMPFGC